MTPQIKRRIEQIKRGEVPVGYKKTKVGIVPVEWEETCLGDIYTERKEPGNESLPLLMVSIHTGVSDGEVDEDDLPKKVRRIEDKSQYKRAASGDLVFNMMRAWQGAIGTVRTEGMVSPAYVVAMPNDMVVPLFIDYYIKTPRMIGTINCQSYGVTDFRKRLYWDSFAPISCALPTIKEQEKIAEILAAQDKVIALKEKLLEEKKKQKKYLMQQLLTGKKRLPGFEGKWKTIFLKDISIKQKAKNDGFRYKTVFSNSAQRGIVLQEEQFDKDIANVESIDRYYIVLPGMFVYNPRISVTAPCGPINVNETNITGVMSPLYTVFSVDNPAVNNLFLKFYFQSTIWFRYMTGVANYGARHDRMSITDEDFFGMDISFPPLDEQTAIANALDNADKEISIIQKLIDQEKQKKKALMQLLLTGIVRTV